MQQLARTCLLALALVALTVVPSASSGVDRPSSSKAAALSRAEHAAKPVRRAAARKRVLPVGTRAARLARRWLGTPYVWGGSSPRGFDCSGLTSFVYRRLGISLPHNAAAQWSVGQPVARNRLRPGDLVFFSGLGHVGLYVGRGRMIHAPQSGDRVRVTLIASRAGSYVGARRVA
jgi:cell wall-associated NlpC family hydrolase